jgi:acetyl esterase
MESELLPDVRKFLDDLNKNGPYNYDVEHIRRAAAFLPAMDCPPKPLTVIKDLEAECSIGKIKFRFFDRRETRAPCPILIYFHGGAFVAGSIVSHTTICTELADYLDIPVVLPEFRLAPEYTFPAAIDDCEAFSRFIANSPTIIDREVTGLVVAGDSSGGTTAIVISQILRDNPARVPVILQAPLYPLPNPEGEYYSVVKFAEGYYGTKETHEIYKKVYNPIIDDPRFSPILGKHHDMPKTVIVTCEYDMHRDSGRDYATKLIQHGNKVTFLEFKGMIHAFAGFRKLIPSAELAFEQVLSHIRTNLEE